MKRVLCLLLIACSIHVWGQDFASKFMEQCAKEDGDIQCQTVSPIMMEKLMDTMTAPDGDRDEEVPEYLLSKLKSARIITATKQSEKLFREAEQLIEKNKNRFSCAFTAPTLPAERAPASVSVSRLRQAL